MAPTDFKKGTIKMMKFWIIGLFTLITLPLQAGVNADVRQGSKLYQKGKYGQALSAFEHALQQDPKNQSASFGAGASAYYLKEYDQAAQSFENAAGQPGTLQQDAWFNLGNTYYRTQNKEKAIASYKQAILQNPQDKEAIHNLQLVLQQQAQQNKNNQNQQNENENSNNQDKQDNPDHKGQAPQQQPQQPSSPQPQEAQDNQEKQAADRVLQLARDSEYKKPTQPGPSANDEQVEKDW